MLNLWSSRRAVLVETGSSSQTSNRICRLLFCSTVIHPNNLSLCTSIYFYLSMLIFAHSSSSLMLPSYADITIETVAVQTHNNVAAFVRDGPAKRAPMICRLQVSKFSFLSHGLSLNTLTNASTRPLQSVNKRKNNFPCYQKKCFRCKTNKLRRLSPRANYTDRATAACRRS
jgi:hypothetical protein